MKRYISRIDPEENLKALLDFSKGNQFTLWELTFEQLDYREREIFFKNLNNTINTLPFVPENKMIDFLDEFFQHNKFKENFDLQAYPELIKKTQSFWKDIEIDFSNVNGFLFLIPLLGDKYLSEYLDKKDDSSLYYACQAENLKENKEKIILRLFERGYSHFLSSLKTEYFFISSINQSKEFEVEIVENSETKLVKKTLYELCKETAFKNVDLIPTHNKIFNYTDYNKTDYYEWLKVQIKDNNNKNIEYFREKIFPKLSEEEKEYIMPALLPEQDNLKLFNAFLQTGFGLKSIYEYKPKTHQILKGLNEYQDKNLIKKMIRKGYVNLMDYKVDGNSIIFSVEDLFSYQPIEKLKKISCEEYFQSDKIFYYLINNKIKVKEYYKEAGAETYADRPFTEKELTMAQICTHKKHDHFLSILNFNPKDYNKHLGNIDPEFKYKKYNELKDEKKLIFVERLLEKVYFGPVYQLTEKNWDSHKKYLTNLSNIYFSDYNTKESIHLISEHLNLIQKLGIKNPKYMDEYFSFLCDFVETHMFTIRRLNKDSAPVDQISQIIDLLGNEKKYDWKKIKNELDKIKPEDKTNSDTNEIIYSHLHLIALKNTLSVDSNPVYKKLKI